MDGSISNTELNVEPEISKHKEKYNETQQASPEAKREIHEMFLKGYTSFEIAPLINLKYDVTKRTIYRWIKDVLQAIGDVQRRSNKNLDQNIGLAIGRLSSVYSKALEKDELDLAFKILQEINKLQGLIPVVGKSPNRPGRPPAKLKEPTKPNPVLHDLTKDELIKMVSGEKPIEERDEGN